MSRIIDTLIPPCPPARDLKGLGQKSKRHNRIRAVDFDNDEDSLIRPEQNTKHSKNKRTPKINNFDEEEETKYTKKTIFCL